MFIDTAGFRVRAPEAFLPRLESYVGRPVVFGVRPEDMSLHDSATGPNNGNTISARADVVETLGSEIFVYLTCEAQTIVARMEVQDSPPAVGQRLEVDLKMSKTHVFDKETSRTIV